MNNIAIQKVSTYDPRWFIWTIMILLVTGVGLVSYIMISDSGVEDSGVLVKHRKPTNIVQNSDTAEIDPTGSSAD